MFVYQNMLKFFGRFDRIRWTYWAIHEKLKTIKWSKEKVNKPNRTAIQFYIYFFLKQLFRMRLGFLFVATHLKSGVFLQDLDSSLM